MPSQRPPRATDVLPQRTLRWPEAVRIALKDVVHSGRDLEFREFEFARLNSPYSKEEDGKSEVCFALVSDDGLDRVILIGSSVLIDQIRELIKSGNVPFVASIKQEKQYYTFGKAMTAPQHSCTSK